MSALLRQDKVVSAFRYLDKLREKASMNMLAAAPFLEIDEGIPIQVARVVLRAWTDSFQWDPDPAVRAHMVRDRFDGAGADFKVFGIADDGTNTELASFTNSAEARAWLGRYTSKEDAGGWDQIEIYDLRGPDPERVNFWTRPSEGELR